MSESKTPRTDYAKQIPEKFDELDYVVHEDFARTLERELNEAKSEVERLKTQLGSAYKGEWPEDYGLKLRTRKGA